MTTSNNINETSGLAYIDLKSDNPYDLFNDWYRDACKFHTGLPSALCLATVSKDLKVSARHVVLRRLAKDGSFWIYTDNRSRKTKELAEVPSAAMCFLWTYLDDKNQKIARQVRIEGEIVVLDKQSYLDLYENEKLFCKIRAYICHQDQEVDWNDLKNHHDQILADYKQKKTTLPMPDHFIGYKMIPKSMEFYFAKDSLIGDRILFERDDPSSPWNHKRLAA